MAAASKISGPRFPCVANSHFTAAKYRNAFGVDPCLIPPFINAELYKTATSRQNVTFINPHRKKGLHIALGLAHFCPEIPFTFVESWPLSPDEMNILKAGLRTAPNVTFLRAQDDMRAIYSRCRILLAPSIWEEAFGRVASEAQLNGIPVLASNRGGLPEAVGPGGIVLDPAAPIADWAAVLRKLWNDRTYYARLSEAALAHAQRDELDPAHQLKAWENLLVSVASRKAAQPVTSTAEPELCCP